MSRFDLNTKTEWGGWAKAVLMQEADLATVADCCAAAALLEDSVAAKDARIADLEATLRVLRTPTPGKETTPPPDEQVEADMENYITPETP